MSHASHGLEALAQRFGTPFYLYDLDAIRAKAHHVRRALDGAGVAYALKANPHPRIAHALAEIVDGADVSSGPEIERAIEAGFRSITFSGPGKTAAAVARAAAIGARITAEAEDQWSLIASYAGPRAVRVNPAGRVHAYRVAMGGVPSVFGVDEDALWSLPRPIGVQVFAGSMIDSPRGVMKSVVATLDLVERLGGVDWVSFGGGFTPGLDVTRLGALLRPALARFREATGRDATFGFELGRNLVADAGIYVARVVSVKTSRGERFAILDGGMNHALFATGHLGGEPAPAYSLADRPKELVHLCGPLCTPLDRFGRMMIASPRVGDLIVFPSRGAYGLTASPHGFISHEPPAELFVEDGVTTA